MSHDLEKADIAVTVVGELLSIEQKILAVKIIRYMYGASLAQAKKFVDSVEFCLKYSRP